jgi:pyruvate dehydrogenase E1 component
VSPDVSISTGLGGWINRVGAFWPKEAQVPASPNQVLRWQPSPDGRHIELGISEMNLFALLTQLGLARELSGEPLAPIGTLYDPFVCRGLDALIYGAYSGSRFIFAGTPSGVSLAPEGGAHQSTITASIGTELPGVVLYEPAFPAEVDWLLCDAVKRALSDAFPPEVAYFRLSTRPVGPAPFAEAAARAGPDLADQVLAGAYRLVDPWATCASPAAQACSSSPRRQGSTVSGSIRCKKRSAPPATARPSARCTGAPTKTRSEPRS